MASHLSSSHLTVEVRRIAVKGSLPSEVQPGAFPERRIAAILRYRAIAIRLPGRAAMKPFETYPLRSL